MSVNHKGKESLILDLPHVNQYIEKRKHKFESVSEAIQYIIKDGT
jgi:succinylglutamate desuccinylase